MLTKLLRPGDDGFGEPETWRPSGNPSVNALARRVAAGNVPGSPEDVKKQQADDEQKTAMRRRITELEGALEQRVREAKDAGYREGENAGRTQATAQFQPMLEQLGRSLQELGELRPKLRLQAESDLLKLALAIAKKVLHRELSIDPESVAGLIKVAVEKIRVQEIIRVRIHPQHQPTLQKILARLSTAAPIEIYADPKLQLGGVVVETTRGDFDSSVDLQLREIESGLTDHLASKK